MRCLCAVFKSCVGEEGTFTRRTTIGRKYFTIYPTCDILYYFGFDNKQKKKNPDFAMEKTQYCTPSDDF